MCHVLIIEDEWLIADHIEQVVRGAGATSVEFAACEIEAVQAANNRRPEIIMSDVNLRAGTGPSAVQAIQVQWGPIPVIFITASPRDCTPREVHAVILTKPFDEQALTEAFKRLVPQP